VAPFYRSVGGYTELTNRRGICTRESPRPAIHPKIRQCRIEDQRPPVCPKGRRATLTSPLTL